MLRHAWIPALMVLVACEKRDTVAPVIQLLQDTVPIHVLGEPYIDPGAIVMDNHLCDASAYLETDDQVDVQAYGTYPVIYTATDPEGNSSQATRSVDIVLEPSDFHNLHYQATDSCTSGTFTYTGLIQDCDCDSAAVTVGNISNFGLSALFTLPVQGTYGEWLQLDTTRLKLRRAATRGRHCSGHMAARASTFCSNALLLLPVKLPL